MEDQSDSAWQRRKEFINKVAQKLGIDPDKVAAALQEARRERVDQVVTERIQWAVQHGAISQTEADQIRDWWKRRPEGLYKVFLGQMRGHEFGKTWAKHFQKEQKPAP